MNREIQVRLKGSPRAGLSGATLAFFIGLAAVALFGPTARKLAPLIGADTATLGLLIAIPSLTGSLLRIPFGAWVDRVGGRIPNLTLLLISAVGMVGLAIVFTLNVPSLAILMILGACAGAGIATFSVGIAQVSYWYPKKRQGSALGLYAGIANMSPGIFSFLIPLALTGVGIAGTYWLWVIFLVAGLLAYLALGRDAWYFQFRSSGLDDHQAKTEAAQQGQELFPTGTVLKSLGMSARYWQTWILVGMYFTSFGGFLALTAWFPTFWQGMFGTDLLTAGILTAVFSIGASVARAISGFATDRLGGEKSAGLALSLILAGSLLMLIASDFGVAIFAVSVIALGMGLNNAATFKILPAVIPDAIGGAAGWVGGLGAFGGFVYPVMSAAFVTSTDIGDSGYLAGFWIFVISSLISLALLGLLVSSRKSVRRTRTA